MILHGQHLVNGIYAETPITYLNQFEKAIKGKKFLDIGCGKGFIVDYALFLGADAYGIEIEDELYQEAIKEPELKDRILKGDVFMHDLSKYEVLFYYLNGCHQQKELFDKITREFRGFIIIFNG